MAQNDDADVLITLQSPYLTFDEVFPPNLFKKTDLKDDGKRTWLDCQIHLIILNDLANAF